MLSALIGRILGFNWLSKHALLTAFFPNLVFVALIGVFLWPERPTTADALAAAGGTAAAADATAPLPLSDPVIAFLFAATVVALAYITINLQPTFLRLFQGDFAPDGPLGRLATAARRRWRKIIDARRARDSSMEELQALCFERLDPALAKARTFAVSGEAQEGGHPATKLLKQINALRTAIENVRADVRISTKQVDALGKALDNLESIESVAGAAAAGPAPSDVPDIERAIREAEASADRLYRHIDAEREWLRRTTGPFVPRDPARAGATRLSNVFYAAEEDLERRYGIRPWLLTPHLRMILPAGYAESVLDDAKLGVDLALTISALSVAYGFVLALVLATEWPDITLLGDPRSQFAVLSQIAVAVTVAVIFGMLLRLFRLEERATARRWVGIIFFAALVSAGTLLLPETSPGVQKWTIFIATFAAAVAAAGAIYLNGVMAAVVYCDGIKTLFDAHRAKILTSMRLRVPSNLTDERALWRSVCDLLARSSKPDPRYFVYVTDPAVTLLAVGDPRGAAPVLAATRRIHAFETLAVADVTNVALYQRDGRDYFENVAPAALTGRVAASDIPYGAPIAKTDVLPGSLDLKGKLVTSLRVPRSILPPGLHTAAKVVLIYGATDGFRSILRLKDVVVIGIEPDGWSRSPNGKSPDVEVAHDRLAVAVGSGHAESLANRVAKGALPLVIVDPT